MLCVASTKVGVVDGEGEIRVEVRESQLEVAAPINVCLFGDDVPISVFDEDVEI